MRAGFLFCGILCIFSRTLPGFIYKTLTQIAHIMIVRFTHFLLGAMLLLALHACSSKPTPAENHLGEIHLQVTGKEEALPHFEKGLLLLHNFEYQDAREAFLNAQEADPEMALAYWGEAMTHNHPLWRQQDYEAAITALEKLASTPDERLAKAATELEKDLLQAVHILYGEGEKFDRDVAYRDYLAGLYQKYPGNQEIAAFYALSLLGAVPAGRDDESFDKGARIAQGILAENPNHPGALHYLIHANDDPGHARLALEAAHNYSEVAADAAHALHMPSHIFVALGMWDEVIASNIAAYNASVRRMEEKGLGAGARNFHSFHWLMYAYLQKAELKKAYDMVLDMQNYAEEAGSISARSYLIEMKANYLIHSEDWNGAIAAIAIEKQDDLNITSRAQDHYIEGRKALATGNTAKALEIIARMKEDRENASRQVSDRGLPMCSTPGASSSVPNRLDLEYALVMELELKALEAWNRGDATTTEQLLREATALEDQTSYAFGPPTIVQPSHELYGEWLLEQGRPEEAKAEFEKAQERGPKRWLSERRIKEI
jgi:tetratricopeptide (TPR) repeat protein